MKEKLVEQGVTSNAPNNNASDRDDSYVESIDDTAETIASSSKAVETNNTGSATVVGSFISTEYRSKYEAG